MGFFLKSFALATMYLAAAKVGLVFGTVSSSATIFWPPGGIALAAVLLGGPRYLPAVFLGACLTAVMVDAPLVFAVGSTLGNTLETLLGYALLTRFGQIDLALDRSRDLLLVILLGGLIPAVASATLGPWTLLVAGLIPTEALPGIMWRWWRADVLGVAFFTPLILLFAQHRPGKTQIAGLRERIALWGVAAFMGQVVLLGWTPPGLAFEHAPSLAWVFPVLLWVGLRADKRECALIQLLLLSQALASAYLRTGYFADDFVRYGLANFWMFAMLLAVCGMALAILSSAQRKIHQQMALNATVFNVSSDGVMIVDAAHNIVAVNAAFTDITGYSAEEAVGHNPRLLSSGRQSPEFYAAMLRAVVETGRWEGEVWNRRKNGEAYLEHLSIHTVQDTAGCVVNRVGIFSDITERRAAQDAIEYQAQHDFLTNLPNRLLFSDRFNRQLAFANRHGAKFAVIYLDLDQFKPVNDMLGHHIGDQLLIAVAGRLQSLVREIDTVSRFGGDEFAILVSEVNTLHDVTTLAEKTLATLSQPFVLEGHTVSVSGSLGIALYPDHGTDMATIMQHADSAMYRAKQCGRNNFFIADSDHPS